MRSLNICCFFSLPVFSSAFPSCNPENPEERFQLYMQILNFFKGLCCVNTQLKQVRVQGDLHLESLRSKKDS